MKEIISKCIEIVFLQFQSKKNYCTTFTYIKDEIKIKSSSFGFQAIPGNDQTASPTNQKNAGSKLEPTSWLMFYGSWGHLESFSGGFLVRICLLGCLQRYLVKSLLFNGTHTMSASSGDSRDLESPGCSVILSF